MIEWWQILLLTLYSAYQICDELTINSSAGSPVFAGFISGLIMGDMTTGLWIGGSLQLMVLGVGTFGGASRIDATSGAVLATAFSVAQGIKPELAISTIAVPVAALMVYTDVLGRFSTTYFAHCIDKNIYYYTGGTDHAAFCRSAAVFQDAKIHLRASGKQIGYRDHTKIQGTAPDQYRIIGKNPHQHSRKQQRG